jgi:hypothetical protein
MTIELTWTPSTSADIAGYRVGYDLPTGIVKTLATVSKDTPRIVIEIDLDGRQLHRFWVQSFDLAGNLSPKKYIHNAYQA